ncbi:MAG: hypothetical protein MUF48_23860, partial [Pirellulaceae bacterium]|nr:hypothetical protein [Pirellulaceae bacterium]
GIAWKQGSSSMNIQRDFEDFLRLLEAHAVEYMIVGGYAVAFHGFPRFAIGVPPVRIDLINTIDGVLFADARQQAVRGKYGRVVVSFMGREDLIRNKRATNRMKDLADVEELS